MTDLVGNPNCWFLMQRLKCKISHDDAHISDPDYNPKEAKKLEDALKKMEKKEKRTLRGTAKAVSLAQKLSPKAQRKKDALMNSTAQLKVRNLCFVSMP